MKNLIKYGVMVFVFASFLGCNEEQPGTIDGQFVQLAVASDATVTENSGTATELRAILGAPQGSDTTISFEVTTDAPASRYMLSATSVVIPAGETEGAITVTPVDNDDIDGDVTLTVSLSSANSLPVGIGGEGVANVSRTITIVDDNVPCNDLNLNFVFDSFPEEIVWSITDQATGMVVASASLGTYAGNAGGTSDETISLPDGCYTWQIQDIPYADGICCAYGDGSYTLSCGAIIHAAGGDYGAGESIDFCVNQ